MHSRKYAKLISICCIVSLLASTNASSVLADDSDTDYRTGKKWVDAVLSKYEDSFQKWNSDSNMESRSKRFTSDSKKLSRSEWSEEVLDDIVNVAITSSESMDLRDEVTSSIKDVKEYDRALEELTDSIRTWSGWSGFSLFVRSTMKPDEVSDTFSYFKDSEVRFVSEVDGGKWVYEVRFPESGRFWKVLKDYVAKWKLPSELFPGIEVLPPTIVTTAAFSTWTYLWGESLSSMWGQSKIGAQDYQAGLKRKAKVLVGIVDTGIDSTHLDLKSNVDMASGYNFVNNTTNAADDHGHGTHVAGVVGSWVSWYGVFWVDSHATLIPLKVLSAQGYGSTYNIANAINYAVGKGIRVLNLSLGWAGSPTTDSLCATISSARSKGTITIVAAGNNGADTANYVPAGCKDAFTVAAVDSSLTRASFSNYGTAVDVAAPGVSVYSSIMGGWYASWNGTSMATPFVAGLAAAVLAHNPTFTPDQIQSVISSNSNTLPVTSSVNIGRFISMSKVMSSLGVIDDTLHPGPVLTIQSEKSGLNSYTVSASAISEGRSIGMYSFFNWSTRISTGMDQSVVVPVTARTNITVEAVDDLGYRSSSSITLEPIANQLPIISNVSISWTGFSSYETAYVSFGVSKALSQDPVVSIWGSPAIQLSRSGSSFTYAYAFNDVYPTSGSYDLPVAISILDIDGNSLTQTGGNVRLLAISTTPAYEAEGLPSSIGTKVQDASAFGWMARKMPQGTSGFWFFGPYQNGLIANKSYAASFRLKVADNASAEVVTVVDIQNPAWDGTRVLKKIRWVDFTTANEYQDFVLPFDWSANGVMEYRLQTTWLAEVYADRVKIDAYDLPSGEVSFESEDLYGQIWLVVSDSGASAGAAIYAKAGHDVPGTFQFGPYRTNLKNKAQYVAKFRLKTDNVSTGQAFALIDAYDAKSGYRQYRELKGTDFDASNTFQDIELEFIKPDTDNLEFRVFFYGVQDLWADKVTATEVIVPKLPDYESENLPGSIGVTVVDPNASWMLARKARVGTDAPGTLQFGPYDSTNLVDGNPYKAIFRLKTPSNADSSFVALIDVFNGDTGLRQYRELKGTDFDSPDTYQDFDVPFTKPAGSSNMEYRVFFYGNADIVSDSVRVEVGTPSGLPSFESESLPSRTGVAVKDSSSSAGKTLSFDKTKHGAGWMQFWPYKVSSANVTAGNSYRANFRLQTDDISNAETIAIVNVFNDAKWVSYDLPIHGTDFAAANMYQDFSIQFPLVDTDMMEFRIYATKNGNIKSDKIFFTE